MKTIKLLFFGLFLSMAQIFAQTDYIQLGGDINGASGDAFGFPVASSSDGTIVAVAAPSAPISELKGQVKVYELSSNTWVQKGNTLNGELNGDSYGKGLSISGNGLVLAVGAPNSKSNFTEFSNSGRVYIFEWNGSGWNGIDTLDANAEQEYFGDALSLSADGSVLAVGLPGAAAGGDSRGAARVYKRNGNSWEQIGSDINGVVNFESFGNTVSVVATATDSVLAIGAPLSSLVMGADDDAGKVHIYRSSAGKWGGSWNATDSIKGSTYDYFGFSVDLADDGSKLIVGAPQSFLNPGTANAKIYTYSSSWTQLGSTITSNLTGDELGKAVAISGDGTHVLLGAPTWVETDSPNGYVELYKYVSTDWVLQDSIAGAASEDAFGTSVAINSDASKFIVGATGNDEAGPDAGQATVYHPYVPDTSKPTVTITTTENEYTNAKPFSVTITFSEEVSGFVVGDITVTNGSASNLNTSDNTVYTADITPTADGQITVDVAAGVAADLAANTNEAATQLVRNYDGTGPTVSLSSLSGIITNNNTINIKVTFGEKVSGFAQNDISVTNGTANTCTTADSINFNVQITASAEGAVLVNVAQAAATDSLGNGSSAAQQLSIKYDVTSPTVIILSIKDTTNANPSPVVITFSEVVSGFALADISVSNGSLGSLATNDSMMFTLDITNSTEGINKINIAANVATDSAGNGNLVAVEDTIVYDSTAPVGYLDDQVVSVNSLDAFTYRIIFSEYVTGFELSDISLTNATASNVQNLGVVWGGIMYSIDIAPDGKGDIEVSMPAAAVQDVAGNKNRAVDPFTINYDVTSPTVIISSNAASPTNANLIKLNITFSEKVSGFTLDDLIVSNGNVNSLSAISIDSVEFAAEIIPLNDGKLTVDIAAGATSDVAGNGNIVASQFQLGIDRSSPAVVIASALTGPTNTSPVAVLINFSEKVSGFEASEITITNGSATELQTSDSITFTATIAPTADGDVIIDVAESVVQDSAGNNNSAATQFVFNYDTTAPVAVFEEREAANANEFTIFIGFGEKVTGFELADINVVNGTTISLEYVEAFNVYALTLIANGNGDITLDIAADVATDLAGNNNTAAKQLVILYDVTPPVVGFNIQTTNDNTPELSGTIDDDSAKVMVKILNDTYAATNNKDNTWTLKDGVIFAALDDGAYDVTVIATDAATNADTLKTVGGLTIDTTDPVVTVNSLITNNTTPTLSGTVTDATSGVAGVTVTVNEVDYAATIDGDNWTVNVSTELSDGTYNIIATATDKVNNTSFDSTNDELVIDATEPTVEIKGISTEVRQYAFKVNILFSEAVNGFELTDIVVVNAVASNLETTDTKAYKLDVTPNTGLAKGDLIKLNIAANTAQDAATNGNLAATELSLTYSPKYSGGKGTEADPFLIGTEDDLRMLSDSIGDFSAYFKQIANIKMGNEEFTPIGDFENPFKGKYDGQVYTISGASNFKKVFASLSSPFYGSGLFGYINEANLINIGFVSLNINETSGNTYNGMVVSSNASNITNCYVTGSIKGDHQYISTGGIVGYVSQTTITGCFTDININTKNPESVGGLVAVATNNSRIEDSYSLSNLDLYDVDQIDRGWYNMYGGLVGEVGIEKTSPTVNSLMIVNSYYAGVTKIIQNDDREVITYHMGGLVGRLHDDCFVDVRNSFWDLNISRIDRTTGGGLGISTDQMKNVATYTNAGWDFKNESANGTQDTWTYSFYYPFLSWQIDRLQDFTISGKVVDENGNVFTAGTVKAYKDFKETGSATLDAEGNFSLDLVKGQHLLVVIPNNGDQYMNTYYGNTNNGFKSKIAMYHNSGVEIQMIAKSQQNVLDGNGRVKGRVVKNSKKAAEIVQGEMLEGEGLEGVTVFLVRVSDGEIMTSVVTDANGDFEITGIPEGEYQLMLDVVGIDANLEGSTFTVDEEGTPVVVSATVAEDGIVFDVGEETVGIIEDRIVSIYPNPARNYLNIITAGEAVVKVTDMRGSVVLNKTFIDKAQLNVQSLKNGVYIIELGNKQGVVVEKLIKK